MVTVAFRDPDVVRTLDRELTFQGWAARRSTISAALGDESARMGAPQATL